MLPKKQSNISKVKYKNLEKKEEFFLRALSEIAESNPTVDIADCGFTAQATYFCPEHSKPQTCSQNVRSGGWIPASTIAKKQYAKCKAIKEDVNAEHFNIAFDNSFK